MISKKVLSLPVLVLRDSELSTLRLGVRPCCTRREHRSQAACGSANTFRVVNICQGYFYYSFMIPARRGCGFLGVRIPKVTWPSTPTKNKTSAGVYFTLTFNEVHSTPQRIPYLSGMSMPVLGIVAGIAPRSARRIALVAAPLSTGHGYRTSIGRARLFVSLYRRLYGHALSNSLSF